MSAPHNKERYGEIWPQQRIDVSLRELELIKPWVILSGGWAWHFMSPKNHTEYKHGHDHKDIDLFVEPRYVATVVSKLKHRQFERVWTRYDKLPSEEEFRRYEKLVSIDDGVKTIRVTVDFFVRDNVPHRNINGWNVIEPAYLLTLYRNIHGSDKCFAVRAAVKLIDKGIDPVGREELVTMPEQE
jgi:hypothetical protein